MHCVAASDSLNKREMLNMFKKGVEAMSTKTASAPQKTMSTRKYLIYLVIGLFFMFVFGYICPTWGPVTRTGVNAISIFAATLFMVTTGFGLIIPSMLAMFAITLTNYTSVGGIISSTFGSTSLYQLFLVYVLCTGITQSGAGDVFARWMLSRKFVNGKPVLFTMVFMITICLFASLVGASGSLLFSFTLIDSICEALGYGPHSQFKKVYVLGAMISSSIGSPILPFKGMGLLIFGNVSAVLKEGGLPISSGAYIASAFVFAMAFNIIFSLLIKPVFKADISKLKNADMAAIMGGGKIKMNAQQALCFWGFVIACCYSIVQLFIPQDSPIYGPFNNITQAFTFALVICILGLLRIDKKPVINVSKLFKDGIRWEVIYAYCAFSTLGSMLAADALGIKAWLTSVLDPLFGNMPFMFFVLILVAATLIITNFFSNYATAIIVSSLAMPYMLSYGQNLGVNLNVLAAAIVSAANTAYMTMGAGNMSAVFLGQECYQDNAKWIWKWGVLAAVLYIVIAWITNTLFCYIL